MSRIKSILAYLLAVLGVPILLVTFMGMPVWMNLFVEASGLTISPWFSGGEVAATIHHDKYHLDIHQPVFQALIGERQRGFVQIVWAPKGFVPAQIDEAIDYDGDGTPDFRVEWAPPAGPAVITPYSPHVLGLEGRYNLEDGYALRVNLSNK